MLERNSSTVKLQEAASSDTGLLTCRASCSPSPNQKFLLL